MFGVKLRCLMLVELDLIPEKVKFYIGPIYARSGVWSHVIWTTQNMGEKRGRSDGILISHPIYIETLNFYRSRTLGGFGDQTKEVYPARDDTQLFCPNNFKQFWTEHFPQTAVNAGSTLQVTQLEYSFRLLLNKLPFF